jgi:hypothetical protein
MWGIRATRAGFLLAGLLATVAATGCHCDCCKKLWGGKSVPASQPNGELHAIDRKNDEPDQVLKAWRPTGGFQNQQPAPIAPERVHGGIY